MSAAVTWGLFLQAALVGGKSGDYKTAYAESQKTGKPLLVLVTADWCPACRVIKNRSLPELEKKGAFKELVFIVVDHQRQRKLADKLMKSRTLPQLILFTKHGEQWKREEIIGARSTQQIQTFVEQNQQRVAAAVKMMME